MSPLSPHLPTRSTWEVMLYCASEIINTGTLSSITVRKIITICADFNTVSMLMQRLTRFAKKTSNFHDGSALTAFKVNWLFSSGGNTAAFLSFSPLGPHKRSTAKLCTGTKNSHSIALAHYKNDLKRLMVMDWNTHGRSYSNPIVT